MISTISSSHMPSIQTFPFSKESFEQIKAYPFGLNWPVVYISENGKEVYVGETTSAYNRSKQHYENAERRRLTRIHLLTDEEFNKSAALDIESWLIQYMLADGKFVLQNGNGGLQNHNYYDREKYKAKFEMIWGNLQSMGLTVNTLHDLRNSDLFKYSPYKSLTEDQFSIAHQIVDDLIKNQANTFIVKGRPGTGKTILATYLFKYLAERKETKHLNIALVVPMTSLRKTLQKVFRKVKNLRGSMVIGPNDVVKQKYDLLIIDEAHRLRRRKNLTNYEAFDIVNSSLGFGNESTELDWIMKSSNHQIFFYDEHQSVKPTDVRPEEFKKLNAKHYELITQMRIKGGEKYLKFIDDIFDITPQPESDFSDYEFKIYDDIHKMVSDIKEKNRKHGLARIVAGYAWPWHTKKKEDRTQDHDIEINDLKLVWNSTGQDWVNSPNAINEVGCIHTVQGYDLNYVGVIIGPELTFNKELNKFEVNKEKYFDINGRAGVNDPAELERYIINIYKTLLTRAIQGTYVYIVDENLRDYFSERLKE